MQGLEAHADEGEGVVTVIVVSHLVPVKPAKHPHTKVLGPL